MSREGLDVAHEIKKSIEEVAFQIKANLEQIDRKAAIFQEMVVKMERDSVNLRKNIDTLLLRSSDFVHREERKINGMLEQLAKENGQ